MKDAWVCAVANVLAEFESNLGSLNRSQVLGNLRVWLGFSRNDESVKEVSSVLREIFESHGAVVLPESKLEGAFDDQLVAEQIKSVDHIAMLAVTPGVSVEALELCNAHKSEADKMIVYVPDEYREGYICNLLRRKHSGNKIKFFRLNNLREPDFGRKMFYDALDVAVAKDRRQKMTPQFAPRIGIITALPIEYQAVKAILRDSQPSILRKLNGYQSYLHGTIAAGSGGLHEIVVALCGKGNNKAAIRATNLLTDYPSVDEIFMVGIAAGVPYPEKAANHVRLGDIVVSDETGVVQYDMIKQNSNRTKYTAPPRPPSADWVRLVQEQIALMPSTPPYWDYLEKMMEAEGFKRPRRDKLNDSPWGDPEATTKHPQDRGRKKNKPKLYSGTIGSANIVLKSAKIRNAIREKFALSAIEMEGSGIADAAWDRSKGYMIVRGICDYANDGKADDWQKYAAFAAAAFSRQLIEAMPLRS